LASTPSLTTGIVKGSGLYRGFASSLRYGDYTTKTRDFGGFWGLTDEVLPVRKKIKRAGREAGAVYRVADKGNGPDGN